MADVIWSCPCCEADLSEWWCDRCETFHFPATVATWDDPPEYQHPDDDTFHGVGGDLRDLD